MKITLEIDDDVLLAVKKLAKQEGITAGKVLSRLVRRGLAMSLVGRKDDARIRKGVPALPSRGEI